MNNEKEDRRVLYTKMFLRESLLELMKKKPVGKITPTELCRHANINRNTFYSHYSSPEALLKSIEDELYERIRLSVERSLRDDSITDFLNEVCREIYANRDLCRTLLSDYGDKDFLRRIVYLAHDNSIAAWKSLGIKDKDGQLELLFTFTTSGSVAVIQKWINEEMNTSPEEVARFIGKATRLNAREFLNL
jgi:Transcriptional regulator